MKKKAGFGKFLAGTIIGAGIGVLFAPNKGSVTRKQLGNKLSELAEKVKTIDLAEIKENMENKIAEIKADLADLDKEKVLAIAKEKGQLVLKKIDELAKLAVKKGTPVIEKAVSEIKKKTINVLEESINKLEESKEKAPVKETVKKTTSKKTTKK